MHTAMTNYYSKLKEKIGIGKHDLSESETEKYVTNTVKLLKSKQLNQTQNISNSLNFARLTLKSKTTTPYRQKAKHIQVKVQNNYVTTTLQTDPDLDRYEARTAKSRLFDRPETHLEHYRTKIMVWFEFD